MGDRKAFFYGTLMSPQILYRVCYGTTDPTPFQKTLLTVRPAILHNYARHKVRGGDYPAIIPSTAPGSSDRASTAALHSLESNSASSVRGTLVSGLTEGDIWRLDIFEGHEYERRKVGVRLLIETTGTVDGTEATLVEGESVDVETYVWIAGMDSLELVEWDFEDFRREKMNRWLGADEYEEIDETVTLPDEADPTGGRGSRGPITKQLQS